MKERLKSINNIPFLVCLGLLLLNDFYLKTTYHNWLTGKLSDFCGLFIFVLFWTALFPTKKRLLYFSTTLLFVIWKSPFAQPFIDLFSSHLYPIYRVVDLTDLMALIILPIAYHFNPKDFSSLKLNPIILSVLTIFSFCATSVSPPSQKFEQPQYLLLKDGVKNIKKAEYPSNYKIHKLDSFLLVNIREIIIDKRAPLDDEYHKTQILKNLDLHFLSAITGEYSAQGKLSAYKKQRDTLMVDDSTSIILKLDLFRDHLHFKKARLDGHFKRFENNQLIIDGKYKAGIEDSTWTFYNNQNEIIAKKYFNNGELVKNQLFDNSTVKSEVNFNTRKETVRNKYFLLIILLLLIIGLILKLDLHFNKPEQRPILQTSDLSKIATSFTLPIVIFVIAKCLSSLIPNSYCTFFFEIYIEAFFVYIIILPLLLFVLYGIKLRDRFDLIYYIFLFALSIIFIEECLFLKDLVM